MNNRTKQKGYKQTGTLIIALIIIGLAGAISIPAINATDVPLFADQNMPVWSVVNLILAVNGVLLAAILQRNNKSIWLISALILCAAGMILFIFTQDVNNLMVVADRWTILQAALFAGEIAALRLAAGTNYLRRADIEVNAE